MYKAVKPKPAGTLIFPGGCRLWNAERRSLGKGQHREALITTSAPHPLLWGQHRTRGYHYYADSCSLNHFNPFWVLYFLLLCCQVTFFFLFFVSVRWFHICCDIVFKWWKSLTEKKAWLLNEYMNKWQTSCYLLTILSISLNVLRLRSHPSHPVTRRHLWI